MPVFLISQFLSLLRGVDRRRGYYFLLCPKRTMAAASSKSIVSSVIPARSFRNKNTHNNTVVLYPTTKTKRLNQKEYDRIPHERTRRKLIYEDNLDLAMRQAERYLARIQFTPVPSSAAATADGSSSSSYTEYYLLQALETIDLFRKLRSPNPRAVQLSFRLLDRLTIEFAAAYNNHNRHTKKHPRNQTIMHPLLQKCLGNSKWIVPLVKTWSKAIVNQQQQQQHPTSSTTTLPLSPPKPEEIVLFTPRQLLELLRVMSERISNCATTSTTTIGTMMNRDCNFTFLDPYVASIITDVEISIFHSDTPNLQPAVANELVHWMRTVANMNQRLDPASYNQILRAYVRADDSGMENVPFTARKIQEILRTMEEDGVTPDQETFRILIRFWGKQPRSPDGFAITQMERILERMQQQQQQQHGMTRLDFMGVAQVVVAYANHDCIDPAIAYLYELLRLQRWKDLEHTIYVAEAVQQLLHAHARILYQDLPDGDDDDDDAARNEQKEQILQSARNVFDKVDHGLRVSVFDKGKEERRRSVCSRLIHASCTIENVETKRNVGY
jgi:hypothetical protein